MDILSILYNVFIQPLQLVFEIIYNTANYYTDHPGLSIIVLSLTMNFLVLPLYKRADEMQEKQRDIEMKLKKGVDHINKSFQGDERMMILQTYYRQNHYKPTDALNGSISLLLEIPFFIAAYQFLSHLTILEGISLGPIMDLSKPDALLVIGGMTFHLLPILMTVVNVVSSAIYLKGFPLKTKIQLYAMALFFLVFLYESPSGLVFYWTLNNVFSLCKNIFYKLKNPTKALYYLFSIMGITLLLTGLVFYPTKHIDKRIFLSALGIILQIPLLLNILKKKKDKKENDKDKPLFSNIILSGLLVSLIIGAFIPSAVISASPEEFISITYFHNPILYILYSFSLSLGFFVVWIGVFYWLANHKVRVLFENGIFTFSIIAIVNYMFFGTGLGNLLPNLSYENGLIFETFELVLNVMLVVVIAFVVLFIIKRFRRIIPNVLVVLTLAFTALSGYNIYNIHDVVVNYQSKTEDILQNIPNFSLNKNGKNVIVLLLDRGLNSQIPYIFNEKPELKEKFNGFTYYSNTISYGGYTNFGTPSVFGGYEYTPVELNKRDDELLVDKHNESLKVLPHLFDSNHFEVTVCDPSYANYTWIPDLSIYDEYPNIKSYITEGRFSNEETEMTNINNNYRNFFMFGFMKSIPLVLQDYVYDSGNYKQISESSTSYGKKISYSIQTVQSQTVASGMYNNFLKSYNVLNNLKNITTIKDSDKNTFMMMVNNTTHEPMMLQTPEYKPSMFVDNTQYFNDNLDKYTIDGKTLHLDNSMQIIHYHANMAAMIQLGEWFDYMRENNVYDNTKIILVADHGRALGQIDDLIFDKEDESKNVELFYPLLMVKDFNSDGFNESKEFMTNADVPALALKDLIENPINPFTGNPITNDAKLSGMQYIIRSNNWHTDKNNGNTFLPSKWATVKDNIWNKDNWTFIDEEVVFPNK